VLLYHLKSISFLTMLMLVFANGILADECVDYRTGPRWVATCDHPEDAQRSRIALNHLFVADGGEGLKVLDLADPALPIPAGELATGGWTRDLAIEGSRMIVSAGSAGLLLVDITTPWAPEIIHTYATPWTVEAVAISGDLACFSDSENQLQVLNIADPGAFEWLGALDLPDSGRRLEFLGDLLLVACDEQGLQVVDLTDPSTPVIMGSYDPGVRVRSLSVQDPLVALGCDDALILVDVSDGTNPTFVGTAALADAAKDVHLDGSMAYAASGGLAIIDIDQPAEPQVVGRALPGGSVIGVVFHRNLVYLSADYAGVYVFDVSRPVSPQAIGELDVGSSGRDVVSSGDVVFLAAGWGGLTVADCSDPRDPEPIGALEYNSSIGGLALDGDLLFLVSGANNQGQFRIYDVSDPSDPGYVGFSWVEQSAHVVTVDGQHAYVGSWNYDDGRLTVIDYTNPGVPATVGFLEIGEPLTAMVLRDDLLWIAGGYLGLLAVDVSNPATPSIAHSLSGITPATGLDIVGDMAWITTITGLTAVDISDPASMAILGDLPLMNWSLSVVVDTGIAYVGGAELAVVDVSDPSAPALLGGLPYGASPNRISDSGLLLLVGGNGLRIALKQCDLVASAADHAPAQSALHLQAAPNPFNPVTTISYDVPAGGHLSLGIYDLSGRRVAVLHEGIVAAGAYTAGWAGCDDRGRALSSGLYLCRMSVGGRTATDKLILLK